MAGCWNRVRKNCQVGVKLPDLSLSFPICKKGINAVANAMTLSTVPRRARSEHQPFEALCVQAVEAKKGLIERHRAWTPGTKDSVGTCAG